MASFPGTIPPISPRQEHLPSAYSSSLTIQRVTFQTDPNNCVILWWATMGHWIREALTVVQKNPWNIRLAIALVTSCGGSGSGTANRWRAAPRSPCHPYRPPKLQYLYHQVLSLWPPKSRQNDYQAELFSYDLLYIWLKLVTSEPLRLFPSWMTSESSSVLHQGCPHLRGDHCPPALEIFCCINKLRYFMSGHFCCLWPWMAEWAILLL